MAIPFLSSLEKPARGGGVVVPPRYFYVCTDHGGCWDQNYFPATPPTANSVAVPGVPGHMVSSGPLTATTSGANTVLSPVLTAATSAFASLVPKMNVLRGLDVPWYMAHNTALLGNFARTDGATSNPGDSYSVAQLGARPTIDQVMAASSSFYTPTILANTKSKVLVLSGPDSGAHSWSGTLPLGPSSTVTAVNNTQSSLPLFQSIFGTGTAPAKMRKSPIDLVIGSYNSVMTGSSRISAADKVRLSQHIDQLHSLESTLNATLACTTTPPAPADNAADGIYAASPNFKLYGQLYADVIAAAFACNASRVSTFGFGDTSFFSPSWIAAGQPDWHGNAAHLWYQDQGQQWLAESYQAFFEQMFVYLAAKLNGMQDADGNTVLDNSLLVWAQECCMETHEQYGVQTATFGSAGGALNTGLYCDYRYQNQAAAARMPAHDQTLTPSASITSYVTWPGLLWEQWLATQLLAMGIPSTQWELWKDSTGATQKGYGTPYCQANAYGINFASHYLPNNANWPGGPVTMAMSPYFSNASTPLPFLLKAT